MSEESRFKPGDVVELRSGGPPMTVVSVEASIQCLWYSEFPSYGPDGTHCTAAAFVDRLFPPCALVRRRRGHPAGPPEDDPG